MPNNSGGFQWANLVKTDNTGNIQAKREDITSPFTKENVDMLTSGLSAFFEPSIEKEQAQKEREVLSNFNKTKEIERQTRQKELEIEQLNASRHLMTDEQYSQNLTEINGKYSLAGIDKNTELERMRLEREIVQKNINNPDKMDEELQTLNQAFSQNYSNQTSNVPTEQSTPVYQSNNLPSSPLEQVIGAQNKEELTTALMDKAIGDYYSSMTNANPETMVQNFMQTQELGRLQNQLITDGLGLNVDAEIDENGNSLDAYLDISTSPLTGASEIVLNEEKLEEKLSKSDEYKDLPEDEKNEAIRKEVNKAKLLTYASNYQSNTEAIITKNAEEGKQNAEAVTKIKLQPQVRELQKTGILPKGDNLSIQEIGTEVKKVDDIFLEQYGMSPAAMYSLLSKSNNFSEKDWIRAYKQFKKTDREPTERELEAFKGEALNLQYVTQHLRNIQEELDALDAGYSLIDAIATDKFRETAYYVNDIVARGIFEEKFATKQTTYSDYKAFREHQATIRPQIFQGSDYNDAQAAKVDSAIKTSSSSIAIEKSIQEGAQEESGKVKLKDTVINVHRKHHPSNSNNVPKFKVFGKDMSIYDFFGGRQQYLNIANMNNPAAREDVIKKAILDQANLSIDDKKEFLMSVGIGAESLTDEKKINDVWNQFLSPPDMQSRFEYNYDWMPLKSKENNAKYIWASKLYPTDNVIDWLAENNKLSRNDFDQSVKSVNDDLKNTDEKEAKYINAFKEDMAKETAEYFKSKIEWERDNVDWVAEDPEQRATALPEMFDSLQYMPVVNGIGINVINGNGKIEKFDIFDKNNPVSVPSFWGIESIIESRDKSSGFLEEINEIISDKKNDRGEIAQQKINAIAAIYKSLPINFSNDDIVLLAIDTFLDIEYGDGWLVSGGGANGNIWSIDINKIKPSDTRFPLLRKQYFIGDDIVTTENNSQLNLSNAAFISEFKYDVIKTLIPVMQKGRNNSYARSVYETKGEEKGKNISPTDYDQIGHLIPIAAEWTAAKQALFFKRGYSQGGSYKPLDREEQEIQKILDDKKKKEQYRTN